MSRGRSAARLPQNDRELSLLQSQLTSRKISRSQHQRIRILVDTATGKSLSAIGRDIGLDRKNVALWRDRFKEGLSDLRSFTEGSDRQGVSDRELLDRMMEMLADRPRSGKPAVITPSQVQQIVAIACRKPSDFGHERADWTHKLIAQVAIEQGIVEHLSGRYVGELLKKRDPASAQE